MKIQKETRKWLKYIKKLRSLVFIHVTYRTQPSPSMIEPSKKLNLKLFRDIKQRRIVRFVHSPITREKAANYYTLDMRDFPSSIQEISLNLAQSVIALDDSHVEKLISLNKFPVLARLELLFCLEVNMTSMILKTLSNPQLLTSLGLYLRNRFPQYDEQSLVSIFEFMRKNCPGLDKLDLRITHPTEKLNNLHLPNKLRVLNLWVSVKTERHLQSIGSFLSAIKGLESLDLTIDFDLNSLLSGGEFCEFYRTLDKLTQLKRLCLSFSPREEAHIRSGYVQNFKIPPSSYPALMESIACLAHLKELCLQGLGIEISLQVQQLGEALEKVARQLQRLTLHFEGKALDLDGDLGFINLLSKMTELRELSLSKFLFTQEKCFEDFKEVLRSFKSLERIEMDQFGIPAAGDSILGHLVVSVLKKKGLKEFRTKQIFQEGIRKGKIAIGVLFPEILKENPELRFIKIESQDISYNWWYDPFESFKYV